jgi:glycosyltransferase involved in cell wall biosynthesis
MFDSDVAELAEARPSLGRRLKIAIVMHDFAAGGTERVALHLAGAWVAAGHEVQILCGAEQGAYRARVPASVRVVAVQPAIARAPLSRWRLGRALAKPLSEIAPDVVFLPGNFHFVLANAIRRAAPATPIVAKVSNPPLPGAARTPWRPLMRAGFRHATRSITTFAAMSQGLADEVRALDRTAAVEVVPDPLVLDRVAVEERSPPAPAPRILCVGRLVAQKDIALALHAFAALRRTRPAELDILGDGPERENLERLAGVLGLAGVVRFHGHVDGVEPFLARADALLLTSRFEGVPAAAIEALALDVPVIATRCSSMLADLLSDPVCGVVAAGRDPLELAAALATVCARPRPPAGRIAQSLKAFAPERSAERYLALIDRLRLGLRPADGGPVWTRASLIRLLAGHAVSPAAAQDRVN